MLCLVTVCAGSHHVFRTVDGVCEAVAAVGCLVEVLHGPDLAAHIGRLGLHLSVGIARLPLAELGAADKIILS